MPNDIDAQRDPRFPPPPDPSTRPTPPDPKRAGNSDLITRRFFDSLLIEGRIIDSDLASTKVSFLDKELETPIQVGIILGPNNSKEQLQKQAIAARDTGTVMWVSRHMNIDWIKSCVDLGANVIKVIKPYRDVDLFLEEAHEAIAAGCFAIASDIIHAYSEDGGYDSRREYNGPRSSAELTRIVDSLNVPFIAKGVLSVQDAVKCKDAGVQCVFLSHHHSIMDFAVPPLMILPDVRKAVGDDYPLMVDCGFLDGADVFKALALGADSVYIARGMARYAFKETEDLVGYINRTTAEVRHFMNRTNSPNIKSIDPSVIHRADF